MVQRKTAKLTEVELEFMQVLWSKGKATPEDIRNVLLERGRHLTGGSIRKVLLIMLRKGFVERTKQGKGYVYEAMVKKEQAHRSLIHDLVNRAFGGSASLMLATLLGSSMVSEDDINQMEQLITERKREIEQ